MKKMFWLLLMILLCVTLGAVAEEAVEYTCGDYRYELLQDGSASITKYIGTEADLEIPTELEGHPVSAIGDEAFYWCSSLTSITIPDSVTTIGDEAFYWCISLTSITIPDSVTDIRYNPFSKCDKLTKIIVSDDHPVLATVDGVLFSKQDKRLICYPCAFTADSYTIPQGIQIIGEHAFELCQNLTTITIPDSVTTIGDSAFFSCNGLTRIHIPDSVTTIGNSAFVGCNGLTSITIPDSVMTIGDCPIWGCNNLTKIIVSTDNPVLATIDGVLFSKQDNRLICYPPAISAESYTIPQGIQIIGSNAFCGCENLNTLNIPNSVTTIEDLAFFLCENLTITIPDSVTTIGGGAFAYCGNLTFTVSRDSYAAQYCKDHSLNYTYPDSLDWLNN